MSDNINWIATAAYGWATEAAKAGADKRKIGQIQEMINELACDEKIENEVRTRVMNATPEEETAIWEELERFKRRHPDIVLNHPNGISFWGHVGRTRFPFTRATVEKVFGTKYLDEAERDVYFMNQGQIVTLLINAKFKCSRMEATRIAFTMYLGKDAASWTIRYG